MGIAIKAENVAIRYITGDFKDIGLKEYAMRKLTHNYHVNEFMAVNGVTFELEEGDMLGIIGSNGAGKSTLLKAVSGIMVPTRGKIVAEGEVAALLELGSGFDGDLSVKENAYLRGAMLGYTKQFMDETYDEIIDFAELREFEDRPFKQLSSGMKSRLAFSIASMVNPDILILDEVLSVGDGAFQEKSARKMREIISRGATTILVSHSLQQIRGLCNKVLWLDHGRQVAFGETKEICDRYESYLHGTYNISDENTSTILSECAGVPESSLSGNFNKTTRSLPLLGKNFFLKGLIPCAIIALLVAFASYNLSTHFLNTGNGNTLITISALGDRNEKSSDTSVVFRGASVDDKWYSPRDILAEGSWVEGEDKGGEILTWDDKVKDHSIAINLPSGSNRSLTFNMGPDQGMVNVSIERNNIPLDLYNENTVNLGWSYVLPAGNLDGTEHTAKLVGCASFFIALIVLLLLCFKCNLPAEKKEREVWGDLLRWFCSFVIVWLHSTCNLFYNFGESVESWYPSLIVNSFTAFAVPCFFMLSGAYLLRREHSMSDIIKKRVPKLYFPLLFWSVVYILVNDNPIPSSLMKMLFENQASHLWFMYSIIGIYLLLPLFSKLYKRLGDKEKIYLLALLLIFPGFFHDTQYLADRYVSMPHFAIFWPDLGLFFLGGMIWDIKEKLSGKCILYLGGIITGCAITIAETYLISIRSGSPNSSFYCIGSFGVVLMALSFFCLALSLEERLQNLSERSKKTIHLFGEVSMGVYIVHVLAIKLIGTRTLLGFSFTSNSMGQSNMLAGAILYFSISALVCWAGKNIPLIRRLF